MNTKSILRPLFQAALALCLIAQSLSADTFGKFTYTDNGTTVSITDYPDTEVGSVVIPSTIAGKPVTIIQDYAFYGCNGLTSVSIPNSVTSIGIYAFYNCIGLSDVTVPDNVTSIGDRAFYKCTGLTSVSIGNSVTSIGEMTFYSCTGLTGVSIGNNVASIGDSAFYYCFALTGVTIPNSVISIGDSAFYDCYGLTRVTIPHSVTSIGDLAFFKCAGLTSVTIPNSVTSIGDHTFAKCSGLTSVTIPSSVTTIVGNTFYYCAGLTSAVFLGNAPAMGTGVFDSCASGFTVKYLKGKTGFTSPTWHNYPSVAIDPTPEIDVQQPVGSSLVDGVSKKSFGTTKTGMTGSSKTFTIVNTGTAILSGLAITKTGTNAVDFIVTAPVKTSLSPGASTSFKVTFKPTATGTRNAAIHIKSNDANENPFDIKLSGLGVAP